jgi:hypothetical protein
VSLRIKGIEILGRLNPDALQLLNTLHGFRDDKNEAIRKAAEEAIKVVQRKTVQRTQEDSGRP